MDILDIIQRAENIQHATEVGSVTPQKVGKVMVDTLRVLNEYQTQSGALAIQKIYTSELAMRQDVNPTSDLTTIFLKVGQLVVIVPADPKDSTAGNIYLFAGTDGQKSTWKFVTRIGDFNELYARVLSNETAIANLQNDKANVDGKYPQLTSGFSNNLVGRGEAISAEFTMRAAGGKSIEDGGARVKELQGNAVVWNQLVKNSDFSQGKNNWGIMNNNSFEVENGEAILTITSEPQYNYWAYLVSNSSPQIIVGHKYLLTVEAWVPKTSIINFSLSRYEGSGNLQINAVANTWNFCHAFATGKVVGNVYAAVYPLHMTGPEPYITGDYWKQRNYFAYDLTLMFGQGNEPTTLEDFYARKPIGVDINAYDEGNLIPFHADAIKTIGFNAWDGVAYDGYVDDASGVFQPSSVRKRTGYIRVLPNQDYYIKSTPSAQWAAWYDANKNYIGGFYGYNRVVTSPSNAAYIVLTIRNKVEDTIDFCINLSHTGYRNGEYKPYEDFVRPIDADIYKKLIIGLKSAGRAHDVIYNRNGKGYIEERVGVTTLEQLTWSVENAELGIFKASGRPVAGKNNCICSRYALSALSSGVTNMGDMEIMAHDSDKLWYVRNSAYANQPAGAFQDAMFGVTLLYELAEPNVYEFAEPFNLDYRVWDFGTEEIVADTPSAPLRAEIAYGFNAVDEIRENTLAIEDLNRSLLAKIAELENRIIDLESEHGLA